MHITTEKFMHVSTNSGTVVKIPYTYESVTYYNLIAHYAGNAPNGMDRKITCVKLVRDMLGLSLKQAVAMVHDASRITGSWPNHIEFEE